MFFRRVCWIFLLDRRGCLRIFPIVSVKSIDGDGR